MKRSISTIIFGMLVIVGIAGCDAEQQDIPELLEPVVEEIQEIEDDSAKTKIEVYDAVVVPVSKEYSFNSYGYVEAVYVSVGDKVKKGDLMATLYSYDLQDEWEKLRLAQSEIDSEIRLIDSEISGKNWMEKEISELKASLKIKNLVEKRDEINQGIELVKWKVETRRLYATEDGVVVGTAIKPGNVVQQGQKVIVVYSQNENIIVSALIDSESLEEADHVYTTLGDKQYEISLIRNSENNSYFACPEGFEAGEDADVAVIFNGDALLKKENYPNTVKAETIFAGQDGIPVYSQCGGVLKFIRFETSAHIELKMGDPIASYYEEIDPLLIKDYELELEYLLASGEEEKASELADYIEELKAAGEPKLIVAPYDGVCVKLENYYAEKEINNGASVVQFSPLDGRKLRLSDSSGKFKYGQRVSVAGKVAGEDFVGYGVVISVSRYDLGAEYNDNRAIVVLDENSEALYNSYNVFATVEGSQYILK